MTFEELKSQFEEHGYRIEGNDFILEKVDYSTVMINGMIQRQPHKSVFKMRYVSECGMNSMDSDDSETLFQFDVLDADDETVVSICVHEFKDIEFLLR